MLDMLGFELTAWDYATFATLFLAVAAFLVILVWFAGLPGRIALSRNHPEAEAVKIMGYAGLLPTIYPWVQAFIWAFKPTDVVDIRRFPREQARATEIENARLSGKPTPNVATPETDSAPSKPGAEASNP